MTRWEEKCGRCGSKDTEWNDNHMMQRTTKECNSCGYIEEQEYEEEE